jgi:hypothetical protein
VSKKKLLQAYSRALRYWWAEWRAGRQSALQTIDHILLAARSTFTPAECRALALVGSRAVTLPGEEAAQC